MHYKFKSSSDFNSFTFGGSVTSVLDLKRHIVEKMKLGNGTDFDLRITNAQTGEGSRAFARVRCVFFFLVFFFLLFRSARRIARLCVSVADAL